MLSYIEALKKETTPAIELTQGLFNFFVDKIEVYSKEDIKVYLKDGSFVKESA